MPIPYTLNPLGISVWEELPLTFTAVEASTVKLNAMGSPTVSGLHYRLGTSGPWLAYTIGTEIPLSAGEIVQFWNSAETLSTSGSNYVQFAMTGQIAASGNIQSMLNYTEQCSDYCFYQIMRGCTALVSAPMFPSLLLAQNCYNSALYGCSSLRNFPDLPAVTPAARCYWGMGRGCSSISKVKINLTYLNSQSCAYMLHSCTGLKEIEVSFSSWTNSDFTTYEWTNSITGSGTFIKPAALPEEYGPNRIPTGWTVVNK